MNFENINNKLDNRDYVKNSFSIGDKTYYTNGKLILRIKSNDEKIKPLEEKYKNIKNIILNIFENTDFNEKDFVDLPVLPEVKYVKCSKCKGSGKDLTCYECDGEMEVNVSNEYSTYVVECNTCNGLGEINPNNAYNIHNECQKCNGSALEYDYENNYITIFNKNIDMEIANLIKDLSNLKISYQENYFVIKFDEGDGVFKEAF